MVVIITPLNSTLSSPNSFSSKSPNLFLPDLFPETKRQAHLPPNSGTCCTRARFWDILRFRLPRERKMATRIARDERSRFHNDPVYFAVQECKWKEVILRILLQGDTVPRSSKHAERMSESQKLKLARNKKNFDCKVKEVQAKGQKDVQIANEVRK